MIWALLGVSFVLGIVAWLLILGGDLDQDDGIRSDHAQDFLDRILED